MSALNFACEVIARHIYHNEPGGYMITADESGFAVRKFFNGLGIDETDPCHSAAQDTFQIVNDMLKNLVHSQGLLITEIEGDYFRLREEGGLYSLYKYGNDKPGMKGLTEKQSTEILAVLNTKE